MTVFCQVAEGNQIEAARVPENHAGAWRPWINAEYIDDPGPGLDRLPPRQQTAAMAAVDFAKRRGGFDPGRHSLTVTVWHYLEGDPLYENGLPKMCLCTVFHLGKDVL